MNIFKILASGDGSIKEPNISAFMGYLLNPNEDHGLGSIFLRKLLYEHYKQNIKGDEFLFELYDEDGEYIIDLSLSSEYRVDVFFEQSFRDKINSPKSIVDIIIALYQINKSRKESILINSLIRKKKLKHILLIELKIDDSASSSKKDKKVDSKEDNTIQQLVSHINNTKSELNKIFEDKESLAIDFDGNKSIEKIFSMICITPNGIESNKRFDELKANGDFKEIAKSHIYWKTEEDKLHNDSSEEKLSIETLLEQILGNSNSERKEKSETIPDYTAQTLQSFSNFIYSDFKPVIKEKTSNKELIAGDEMILTHFSSIKKVQFSKILTEINKYVTSIYPETEMRINKTTYPDGTTRLSEKVVAFYFKNTRIKFFRVEPTINSFRLEIFESKEDTSQKFKNFDLKKRGNPLLFITKSLSLTEFNDEEKKLLDYSYNNALNYYNEDLPKSYFKIS